MALVLDGTNGVSGVDGTASNPAIEGTDSNTGIFYPAADTVAIGTGGTERLRVDSSGNVGVGTTSPALPIDVVSNSSALALSIRGRSSDDIGTLMYYTNNGVTNTAQIQMRPNDNEFRFAALGARSQTFYTNGSERARISSAGNLLLGVTSDSGLSGGGDFALKNGASIRFRNAADSAYLNMINVDSSNNLNFGVGGVPVAITFGISGVGEAARFSSGGDFLVGTTGTATSAKGAQLRGDGLIAAVRDGNAPLVVNRLTNDGVLVSLQQATVEEGTISVSGTTVSYNGGHLARWSQLLSGQRDESIVKGTVLSNLDEMCEWTDAEGNPLPNEQLNRMKVSDVEGDTNVAGVFVNWDNDDNDNPYDMNIAMTGDMIIRIAQGVTVQKGDLLMSAGDGTAKPQGDDIVRSKTVAKVTSNHVTCTYDDGSYCVPCVLMAC